MELLELDPRTIQSNGNVRSKLGDLKGLTASIKTVGLLEPLLVRLVPEPDSEPVPWLVAGARRRASAIEAELETVPCIVLAYDDEVDIAAMHSVMAQLAENLARLDLTDAEEAAGFEQLQAFGMAPVDIAAATGRDPKHVKHGLKAASNPAGERALAKNLTIEQAAAVAEFDGDKAAVKELLDTARIGPHRFNHTLSRLLQDRKDDTKRSELATKLADSGVPDLGNRRWSHDLNAGVPVPLSSIQGKTRGKAITPAAHKKCPGHAATVIDMAGGPEITYFCTDPREHDHKGLWATEESAAAAKASMKSPEQESTDRAEVIAGNKAWRAAEPVRRGFIRNLLQRKRPPAAAVRFVTMEFMGDPARVGAGDDALLADLLSQPHDDGPLKTIGLYAYGRSVGLGAARRAPDGQLPMVLLAQLAADREAGMDAHTWRNQEDEQTIARHVRWLEFLEGAGYELADVERKVEVPKK